jgi:hypothetical protein
LDPSGGNFVHTFSFGSKAEAFKSRVVIGAGLPTECLCYGTKNQLCAIKKTILDRDFGTLKIHTRKFYRMVVLGNIIRFIILQALKNI